MVVQPKKLLETVLDGEKETLRSVEKRVDDYLSRQFDGTSSVSISYDTFSGLRRCTVNNFLNKYRSAGWEVNQMDDQREGNFVSFSYRQDPNTNYR